VHISPATRRRALTLKSHVTPVSVLARPPANHPRVGEENEFRQNRRTGSSGSRSTAGAQRGRRQTPSEAQKQAPKLTKRFAPASPITPTSKLNAPCPSQMRLKSRPARKAGAAPHQTPYAKAPPAFLRRGFCIGSFSTCRDQILPAPPSGKVIKGDPRRNNRLKRATLASKVPATSPCAASTTVDAFHGASTSHRRPGVIRHRQSCRATLGLREKYRTAFAQRLCPGAAPALEARRTASA